MNTPEDICPFGPTQPQLLMLVCWVGVQKISTAPLVHVSAALQLLGSIESALMKHPLGGLGVGSGGGAGVGVGGVGIGVGVGSGGGGGSVAGTLHVWNAETTWPHLPIPWLIATSQVRPGLKKGVRQLSAVMPSF